MLKFLKGVVAGSGAGLKDLPYNIGEPYSSAWGSWVHYRGTSKHMLVFSRIILLHFTSCSSKKCGHKAMFEVIVEELQSSSINGLTALSWNFLFRRNLTNSEITDFTTLYGLLEGVSLIEGTEDRRRQDLETQDHISVHCSFARKIWSKVLTELGVVGVIPQPGANIFMTNLEWFLGSKGKTLWRAIVPIDDGAAVSIFSLSGSNANDGHLVAGRNGVKRLRTVRHPNILSFLHSTEAEVLDGSSAKVTIYIVTEPVMPLSEKIKELGLEGSQRDEYYAWGLHRIAKAVSFLNNDCKLVHGNVCTASVVVTQTLDWKLHAFDVLSEFDGNNEASTGPMLDIPWLLCRDENCFGLCVLKFDKLSCLIYELFSGLKLSRQEELRNTAGIPKSLLQDYQRLLSSMPSRRLNPSKLLENSVVIWSPKHHDGQPFDSHENLSLYDEFGREDMLRFASDVSTEYFQNKLVETIQFMEILNLKDSVEKDNFFRKLPNLADQLPRQIVQKKLLPLLASALEFGSATAPALTALLKMGSWLSAEEYGVKVLPTIVKLFASNDRAIRVGLLQHIDQYGESLSAQIVDEQVYPHVSNGFSDTSAFLRELTLKSMLVLAPKVDEEPAIRTNTTILLGNIASYLNEGTRKRVLINAFTVRALRDTFSPARGAGIMALCATSSYYDTTEIATRILPNVVVLTIDPDSVATTAFCHCSLSSVLCSDVRSKAFQAVEQFLQLVKQYHEKTTTGDATGAVGSGISSIPGNASLLGWAMSSLTMKGKPSEQSNLTSSSTSAPLASSISNASSVIEDANLAPVRVNSRTDLTDLADPLPPPSPTSTDGWGELENGIHGEQDNDKDGWDDIEPLEDAKPSAALANIQAAQKRPVSLPKPQVSNSRPKSTLKPSKDDDSDLWGSVADPAPKSTSKPSSAKASRVVDEDDPWGAIAAPVPKSSSKPMNLKSGGSADDDLWASIAAPPPTAGHKPLSAGRGRGNKPAAPRLGAQRINRTSSGM
ncbi:hypothetical protein DH2020_010243 [Rehmannia glutinosa]|uniref:Protein kinase domain-containing protein n=1 Tax=Rehmannia glutinosa TaxID=99300 RepID=A0ABR0XA78_REHGL